MSDIHSDKEIGWYISDTHAVRAIGYLGAALSEQGYLPRPFEQPILLELWGEALQATMDVNEKSPIGPNV